MRTVKDYVDRLKLFPEDWQVVVSTSAGGGISVEHREVDGKPIVAVFGSNGGIFGENPLTDEEYHKKSQEFLRRMDGREWVYTTLYGDHRLYIHHGHPNDGCYGTHYDPRVIDRMVTDGLLEYYKVPYSRDGVRVKK